jgi:hypothetical protein
MRLADVRRNNMLLISGPHMGLRGGESEDGGTYSPTHKGEVMELRDEIPDFVPK